MQRLRALLAACGTCLLAACASAPSGVPDAAPARQPEPTSRPTPSTSAPARPNMSPRGGGYYKDDGPGDNPPPNLDQVPDAQPRLEALLRGPNKPYVALGQSYTPMQALAPYDEVGIGSWYGKKFHGARTSSGEPYDMYAMTAAHPTLPIPSYARVTNLENGKSVVVRINDRGPFHSSRIIDLSYTAAYKLGYVNKGSAKVEVESIIPEGVTMVATAKPIPPLSPVARAPLGGKGGEVAVAPADVVASGSAATGAEAASLPERLLNGETSPDTAPADMPTASAVPAAPTQLANAGSAPVPVAAADGRGVFLQLGAFSSSRNAESFRDYVRQELNGLAERLDILGDGGRYRLQLGPFASTQDARRMADRIADRLKLTPFVVTR